MAMLPEEVKSELEKRLRESRFSNYTELTDWLQAQGFQISRSAVHRHGQKLQKHLDAISVATDQAVAIAEAAGDTPVMGRALSALVQNKLYDLLMDAESEADPVKLARAVADINRADISVLRYKAEVKAKIEAKFTQLESSAKSIDAATLKRVKEEIYGLF